MQLGCPCLLDHMFERRYFREVYCSQRRWQFCDTKFEIMQFRQSHSSSILLQGHCGQSCSKSGFCKECNSEAALDKRQLFLADFYEGLVLQKTRHLQQEGHL